MQNVLTKNMIVSDSIAKPGKVFWMVRSNSGNRLTHGYCDTKDHGIRACRNFIRHNQNKVFD